MNLSKASCLFNFLIICFLLLSLQTLGSFDNKCFFTKKFRVILANGLPPNSQPMRAHVFSGDNELGYHTLYKNQNYTFSFCAGFTTEFFCNLSWGSKEAKFELYKTEKFIYVRCKDVCYWVVRADGIYYSPSYPSIPERIAFPW